MTTEIVGTGRPAIRDMVLAMVFPSPRCSAASLRSGPEVSTKVMMGSENLRARFIVLWAFRKPSGAVGLWGAVSPSGLVRNPLLGDQRYCLTGDAAQS